MWRGSGAAESAGVRYMYLRRTACVYGTVIMLALRNITLVCINAAGETINEVESIGPKSAGTRCPKHIATWGHIGAT